MLVVSRNLAKSYCKKSAPNNTRLAGLSVWESCDCDIFDGIKKD
jgi:hypothetical protein